MNVSPSSFSMFTQHPILEHVSLISALKVASNSDFPLNWANNSAVEIAFVVSTLFGPKEVWFGSTVSSVSSDTSSVVSASVVGASVSDEFVQLAKKPAVIKPINKCFFFIFFIFFAKLQLLFLL